MHNNILISRFIINVPKICCFSNEISSVGINFIETTTIVIIKIFVKKTKLQKFICSQFAMNTSNYNSDTERQRNLVYWK